MAVYVDNMRARYGRMMMCHMLADTEEELHAMALQIGLPRRWHQFAGTPKSHYDTCLSKRALAVSLGAVEVSRTQVALILRQRRAESLRGPDSDRPAV